MSRRYKPGDWVRLCAGAGMVGEADRLRAQIRRGVSRPCPLCDDPECMEWLTLWTEPDPEHDGRRWTLCHVSECQMTPADAPVEDGV